MPGRLEPILTGNIYHVFNKTIESKKIFTNKNSCNHFIELIQYYRSSKVKISFSKLKNLDQQIRSKFITDTQIKKYFKVEILVFCLMPTHFHLLLKQKEDRGIERFCSDVINAFTRYFNIRYERKGPLFLTKFKSVRIRTDGQLIHVSRYIHLNPYTSQIVRDFEDLKNYRWTSLNEYINKKEVFCNTKLILSLFKNDRRKYRVFVKNNADYQKELEKVKYVEKEFKLKIF